MAQNSARDGHGQCGVVCEGMREILQNGDGIYKNGGLRYLLSIDID